MDASTKPKHKLLQVKLGSNCGMKVSELCLGTMVFSKTGDHPENYGMPSINEAESVKILNRFEEWGGTFIDTANAYAGGEAESIVGGWLSTRQRQRFVVSTKFRLAVGQGANDVGASRKHITAAIEASLKNLQTDYVDIYHVHQWDPSTPLKETFSTLNDLVRAGKIRYIGISNFTGWQIAKTAELTERYGLEGVVSYQGHYSLLTRSPEMEVIPACTEYNMAFLPWSPLEGGLLSGRYKRGATEAQEGSRVAWADMVGWKQTDFQSHSKDSTWKVLDALEAVAKETGKTQAQVALRWAMQRPAVKSVLVGAKNVAHLDENLAACGFRLNQTQMDSLTEASQFELPYPYDMQGDS